MGSNPAEDAISLLTPANNDLDNGLISKKNIYAFILLGLILPNPMIRKTAKVIAAINLAQLKNLKKFLEVNFNYKGA